MNTAIVFIRRSCHTPPRSIDEQAELTVSYMQRFSEFTQKLGRGMTSSPANKFALAFSADRGGALRKQVYIGGNFKLDQDEAILAFVFPDGLEAELERLLRADLALLKQQPWSPQAALDAILKDWPSSEPERPYTIEAAEARLLEACDVFLKKVDRAKP